MTSTSARSPLAPRPSSVHPAGSTPGQAHVHSMIVVIDQIGDAVRDIGGWLCDRVWAGWDVTAWVPAGCDTTPLRILGVPAVALDGDPWPIRRPAAIAVGCDLTSLPSALRTKVDVVIRDPRTEVTVWGDRRPLSGNRLHDVQHRLSVAAVAFKTQALHAASLSGTCASTENFLSYTPQSRTAPSAPSRWAATGSAV
ncbi:hypothetical protein FHT40_002465 [Mycolicibacterium sp. BK556]|uniref:hypothetical protein n=1 Tax=unclassified Mycolicibacterium TaxID=2636767 RepID=UPI00160EAAAD|nr:MULTISPECIES: hypothetical protein [unclassified Mycolicibacterium]MBB3602804.1 hypothetical protein [Mycolicibacterium sp. BK556]MBB3632999.1 hypothetical protein [Mycolicibacterium sp. BK607]